MRIVVTGIRLPHAGDLASRASEIAGYVITTSAVYNLLRVLRGTRSGRQMQGPIGACLLALRHPHNATAYIFRAADEMGAFATPPPGHARHDAVRQLLHDVAQVLDEGTLALSQRWITTLVRCWHRDHAGTAVPLRAQAPAPNQAELYGG